MVLTALTLNANSLGSPEKWSKLWSEIPCTDIICLQEIHLLQGNEFAFPLGAQNYDFFYSHSTSSSAGVCTVIKHSLTINLVKSVEVLGRLLGIDFVLNNETYHVINIYAPNVSAERKIFFTSLPQYFTQRLYLLGDFNSVTSHQDCLSGRLDSTSMLFNFLLANHNLSEPDGSNTTCFTFHNPGDSLCQSRIDHIFSNFPLTPLHGYNFYVSFSDHYGITLFRPPPRDLGPKSWCFLSDVLNDDMVVDWLRAILDLFCSRGIS